MQAQAKARRSAKRGAKKAARRVREEPRQRLDVDERRAQLVELGLTHFGGKAYEDVSIDDIAQAAGISKGLLYHYFPTKRAFYVACVRAAAAHLIEMTETPDDTPGLERLTCSLDTYLEYVRSHGRAYATLMRSGSAVDREVVAIVDDTRAKFLERLTKGMEAAVDLSSPLLRIALVGWVGLAEAASLDWVERCIAASASGFTGPPPPSAVEVRDLLAKALLAIFTSGSA
jgi:AcrR family transcriptional regulator